jgi:hypothetical protein
MEQKTTIFSVTDVQMTGAAAAVECGSGRGLTARPEGIAHLVSGAIPPIPLRLYLRYPTLKFAQTAQDRCDFRYAPEVDCVV